MATVVGREEILVTPSDSLGPKVGGMCKRGPSYIALKSP